MMILFHDIFLTWRSRATFGVAALAKNEPRGREASNR
jgi:hypothetical protein